LIFFQAPLTSVISRGGERRKIKRESSLWTGNRDTPYLFKIWIEKRKLMCNNVYHRDNLRYAKGGILLINLLFVNIARRQYA